MANIIIPPGWKIPESEATPESVYRNRRQFLKAMGFAGLGVSTFFATYRANAQDSGKPASATPEMAMEYPGAYGKLYPAKRNEKFTLDRPLTEEKVATTYNNFYEFSTNKNEVHKLVDRFVTNPWEVEIGGLCEKPGTYDVYNLIAKMPLEERLYRFRCVEAWAMAVPWTGFPMKALIKHVGVKNEAKYIRFLTFMRPKQAPGFAKYKNYPFPYFEALTMDEAMTEVALFATGIYGKPLPKQQGAPLRVIVPWKYGLKSIKSLVKIEFTAERPPTFWNKVNGREYSWHSNVEPEVPHPRWSQANERLIGSGERRPTLLYNGYQEYVAHLYA